jgi:xylulokinase
MTDTASTRSDQGGAGVLGIDLGTSSVKVVIANLEGDLIGQADGAYPVSSPRPGWSETDPDVWLSSTTTAVRTALAQADAQILAIGFSGQMHGVVSADRSGAPLRAAMLWSDSRAIDQLASYEGLAAPVRARLANPLSPGMAAPMLAWLRQHEPDVYRATRWALSPKDWLRSRLTGQFATEPSDASATLMYDLVNDSWDLEVVDVLGLDPAKLAPVLPGSGHPAGELSAFAAGAADSAAAALGSRLADPATAQLTIGTGARVVRPVAALPEELSPEPVTHLYRSATQSGWNSMAASLNGGSTFTWVVGILGASWQELYDCAALTPTEDAPLFLPHLHGERRPYLDPGMRGARTGLAPQHRREELLYSTLEGSHSRSVRRSTASWRPVSTSPARDWPAAARPPRRGARCSPTSSNARSLPSTCPPPRRSGQRFSPGRWQEFPNGCLTPNRTRQSPRLIPGPIDPASITGATRAIGNTSPRCGEPHRRTSSCPGGP